MEEIQKAIMHPLKTCPQFVNLVPEQIGFRPSQRMPFLLQAFNFGQTLQLSFDGNVIQPFQHRNGSVFFLIKNNFRLWHITSCLGCYQICEQLSTFVIHVVEGLSPTANVARRERTSGMGRKEAFFSIVFAKATRESRLFRR